MHPYTQYTMATQHQSDLLAEANNERLARSIRKSSPEAPASPRRRLVAAAAAAVLALSLAGAAFGAQGGAANSGTSDNGTHCVGAGHARSAC